MSITIDNSYIYIRDNEWYKQNNVYKVGITTSIKDRNNSYITGEYNRGIFIKIYELYITNEQLKIIDKIFKLKFKNINKYNNGGTEFYDRIIIDKIELFLDKIKIKYKIIDENDLKRINRCRYDIYNNYSSLVKKLNSINNQIKPYNYQLDVLNNIDNFYINNDKGKLLYACGLGKTILSILIVKQLNIYNKILIGVSSCYLQNQFAEEIKRVYNNNCIIILFDGNINNIEILFKDINNNKPIFIITTYHSCYLLLSFKFDFKIGDECHHLVNINNDIENKKKFVLFHKIESIKSLFMTATEKIIDDKEIFNDLFGEVIDEKSFGWAIENKKITDYKLIILKNNKKEIEEIKKSLDKKITNQNLFISVYMLLKSFTINYNNYSPLTHSLLYTNTIEDAKLANNYINEILNLNIIDIDSKDIYFKDLHSQNTKDINTAIKEFESFKYGIISCVQIFGEGVNCIKLNSVCVACNMNSNIRITQYLSRPNRLNPHIKNKVAYYIIPYIENDNISNIIRQLSIIDNKIEDKITTYNSNYNNNYEYKINEFKEIKLTEDLNELLKIKLYLKFTKDLKSDFSEEINEYNYIKNININLKIKSKKEYLNFKDIHNNYIENPDIYFTNKGVWDNWSDFLGYDTCLFIPTKERWISFCKEKEIDTIEKYNYYSDIYKELPKDPEDIYKDFTNISQELNITMIRRRR